MWTVIYIAPTAKIAESIKNRLTQEGFLVKIRPINMSKQQFEILVPSGELEEVQEVLNSHFQLRNGYALISYCALRGVIRVQGLIS